MLTFMKFTTINRTKRISFVDEDDVEIFEICISHKHLNDLNCMFDVNFRDSNEFLMKAN